MYVCIYISTIPTHLKTYQTLFQELITKSSFLWKTYIYNVKSSSYERHSHGMQHHLYLTKKLKEHYVGKVI